MTMLQSARRAAGSAATITLSGSRLLSMGSVAGRSPMSMCAPAVPTHCIARARLAATAAPVPGSSFDMEPAVSAKEKKTEHEKETATYWGVSPTRVVKDDGTEWKWSCFRVRVVVLLQPCREFVPIN